MTKTAIVHEWFTTLAGSERVVEQFCGMYPDADLYAMVADADTVARTDWLRSRHLTTSFIQRLPRSSTRYRSYLPLMPLAVEQFDLSDYELILSSHHAVAKGVLTGPDQLHISYVHSPMRYAWDLQHQYLRESGLDAGLKGWMARYLLHRLRIWDYRTAASVDHFVANSQFVARRIHKVYRRMAQVVYPPVDVDAFTLREDKEDFYLCASRMVPYKRMDVVVQAFAATPHRRLVVVGDGPEMAKIRSMATPNVELLGYQPLPALRDLMQRASAFVFAAEEDFGIMPVEAQACGTPVIAFGRGGSVETVVTDDGPTDFRPTGLLFETQAPGEIRSAVDRFERRRDRYLPSACRANAERFSRERFVREMRECIDALLLVHRHGDAAGMKAVHQSTLSSPAGTVAAELH